MNQWADSDDARAFSDIYPELRRYAAAVCTRGTDPDDLVQDALVRVLRSGGLRRLDNAPAFLRRVVLNLALDERRSFGRRGRAQRKLLTLVHDEPTYPSDLSDLDRLDPIDRAVLYLIHVEGAPQKEVADILNVSHQAVRSRASRARHRLRTAINEEDKQS